jgi:hypothetical protein
MLVDGQRSDHVLDYRNRSNVLRGEISQRIARSIHVVGISVDSVAKSKDH